MSVQSFSLKYALRTVWRRKVRNMYAILGIALGVSLVLGVQVSMAASTAGWEVMFTRGYGDAEARLYPVREPYFNESVYLGLKEAGGNIDGVEAISGRLRLSTTAIEPDSGRLALGVPLNGVPKDENGFGDYLDQRGRKINLALNKTNPDIAYISGPLNATTQFSRQENVNAELLVGKELSEELDAGVGDTLLIVFAEGPFKFNLTKEIDYVFKDEDRGREDNSFAIVMRLDALQPLIADFTGSHASINRVLINFDDSVQTKEEGQAVLDKMAVATTTDITGGYDYTFFLYSNDKYWMLDFVALISDSLNQLLMIFGYLIIISGVLLIINIQLMSVEEREQQVGVLRAIGTQRPQVLLTTIIETICLGFIGSIIGVFGGILYGRVLTESMAWTFGYSASEIPFLPPNMIEIVILSFVMGFLLALFTSLVPAWRASRINIVEVIRGISPPQEKKFGRKGLYVGIALVIIGTFLTLTSGLQPWEQEAWKDINDAEVLYFTIMLPISGLALCGSYFFSKRWSLNIMAFVLIGWTLFANLFILQEWVTEGNGGVWMIFGSIMALVLGSCILIGINLEYVALFMRRTLGTLAGMKAITLVAMEQMASKKMRSTLVFAIFSVILTMNIFLATWAQSFRDGTDETVELSGGNADIIVVADQDIPNSVGFAQLMEDQFDNQGVTSVKGFTRSSASTPVFVDEADVDPALPAPNYEEAYFTKVIPINESSFWAGDSFSYDDWTFQFDLSSTKIPQLETFTGFDLGKRGVQEENERTWAAVASDQTAEDTGNPLAIVPYLGQGFAGPVVDVGDSIWLLDVNQQPVEFTIATLHFGNALTDWEEALGIWAPDHIFISEEQAENLAVFREGINSQSLFLVEVEKNRIKSDANEELANAIEEWANGKNGEFRQSYGVYGIAAIPTWEIFKVELDSFYRILTFLQLFTSGGFLVGVLGLLVVSMRSVQERKREIGMMRSLGFRKLDITFAVLLELVLMGVIGLIVGLLNGIIMGYSLISLFGEGTKLVVPWATIALYTVVILSSAFFAAIIPGWLASRIPPSDALRYAG
ncbi:MAG: FtsX-like permease family protein [Candidatus Thorarchaeota archaeon]